VLLLFFFGSSSSSSSSSRLTVGGIIPPDPFVQVFRPLLEFRFEVRPGRSVLPFVFLPLAVDADLRGLERVGSNGEEFMALGVDHSRQTAGLEGKELDGWIGVEEVDGPEAECPAEVDRQEYHGMFGGVGQIVLSDLLELPGGLQILLGGVDGDRPRVVVRTGDRLCRFRFFRVGRIVFILVAIEIVSGSRDLKTEHRRTRIIASFGSFIASVAVRVEGPVDMIPVDVLRFHRSVPHWPRLVHQDDSKNLRGRKDLGEDHPEVSLSRAQIDDGVGLRWFLFLLFLSEPRVGFDHSEHRIQDRDGLETFLEDAVHVEEALPQPGIRGRKSLPPLDKTVRGLCENIRIVLRERILGQAFLQDSAEILVAGGRKVGKRLVLRFFVVAVAVVVVVVIAVAVAAAAPIVRRSSRCRCRVGLAFGCCCCRLVGFFVLFFGHCTVPQACRIGSIVACVFVNECADRIYCRIDVLRIVGFLWIFLMILSSETKKNNGRCLMFEKVFNLNSKIDK
jgi:hypothetical protein